jgi:hypothetical protein
MRRFNKRAAIRRERCFLLSCRIGFAFLVACLAMAQLSLINEMDWRMPSILAIEGENSGVRRLHEFVNCSAVSIPKRKSNPSAAGVPDENKSSSTKQPCAFLFFGLAKQFRSVVLPSIQEHILQVGENSRCDIYVHNYNISTTVNPMTKEYHNKLDPTEIFALTSNVVWDTEESFKSKRDMSYYAHPNRKPYKTLGWVGKIPLMNMYKQWHSIERVWDMMQEAEQNLNIEYERVGLFRTDVQYMTPIDIFDGDAVIPKFGFLVNDRMFYGKYEHAHVWAKIRYPSVGCYVPRHRSINMHSEFFMNDLILKNLPNVTKKDICFYRARANGAIWDDDCTKKYEFPKHLVDLNLTYN